MARTSMACSSVALTGMFMSRNFTLVRATAPASRHTLARVLSVGIAALRPPRSGTCCLVASRSVEPCAALAPSFCDVQEITSPVTEFGRSHWHRNFGGGWWGGVGRDQLWSGPPGLHTTARELQTCTFEGPGLQSHHQNSTKGPQRERRKNENSGVSGEKRAKFWAASGGERGPWEGPNLGPTQQHTTTHTRTQHTHSADTHADTQNRRFGPTGLSRPKKVDIQNWPKSSILAHPWSRRPHTSNQ